MENQPTVTEEKKNYPIDTTDGFYFQDEQDHSMGVETKKYENGNEVKRIVLSDGKVALVHEMKAWEMEESEKFHGNKPNQFTMAIATMCTKIDDKRVAFEDLKFMKSKDWLKIKYAVALINFQ